MPYIPWKSDMGFNHQFAVQYDDGNAYPARVICTDALDIAGAEVILVLITKHCGNDEEMIAGFTKDGKSCADNNYHLMVKCEASDVIYVRTTDVDFRVIQATHSRGDDEGHRPGWVRYLRIAEIETPDDEG